jgi:hypothetical protein
VINFFVRYCSLYKVWDKNSITKWEYKKQAGIFKFILVEGVVKWGVFSTFIFLSITFFGKEFVLKEAVTTCLIWLIASVVYGFSLWYGTSLSYEKQIKSRR